MKPQTVPHFGVRNGLVRKGREVTNPVPKDDRKPEVELFDGRTFPSVNAAKRFMRTGEQQ